MAGTSSGRKPWRRFRRVRGWLLLVWTFGVVLTSIYPSVGSRPAPFEHEEPIESADNGATSEDTPVRQRTNILIFGIDAGQEGEQARSDTVILASLDPQTRNVALLSIPRDSRVRIPGRGLDKIAHAHVYGGVELAVETVAVNFGVPVHHWVRIDMPRFLKLIDIIGPVTVNVPYDLRLRDGRRLEAGPHRMDSELVLAYLRERYNDRSGDFGRAERQQQFLMDVARQMRSDLSFLDVLRMLPSLIRYVETDMGIRDAAALVRLVWDIHLGQVQRGVVKGRDLMIDGIYYYEIDWDETNELLTTLGIRPSDGGSAAPDAQE